MQVGVAVWVYAEGSKGSLCIKLLHCMNARYGIASVTVTGEYPQGTLEGTPTQ